MQTTQLFKGDQFVGVSTDPNTGDLILRYVIAVTNKPDANGRGITRAVMQKAKQTGSYKGRPLIFAPKERQGGTFGHVDTLGGVDPYKYEVGRMINLEEASAN